MPDKAASGDLRSIEGSYMNDDSSYSIIITKSKNDFRDYAGIITKSKYWQWRTGMVKLELKKINDTSYKVLVYDRNHEYKLRTWTFKNGLLDNGTWVKTGARNANKQENNDEVCYARQMDKQTLYIRITSFGAPFANLIDSVFTKNKALLKSLPYLILDLRGNGGGSDFAYEPIRPYLYTNKVVNVGVDVLATTDNINGWKKAIIGNPDIPEETQKELQKFIDTMEAHKGEFISSAADQNYEAEKTEAYPQHVVVLMDKGCGSTTEQFLLEARQSKKVTLMGMPSAGVLDYANMREGFLPCNDMALYYATTRSRRLKMGMGIDNVGIKPRVPLKENEDWIKAARKYLVNKKPVKNKIR